MGGGGGGGGLGLWIWDGLGLGLGLGLCPCLCLCLRVCGPLREKLWKCSRKISNTVVGLEPAGVMLSFISFLFAA